MCGKCNHKTKVPYFGPRPPAVTIGQLHALLQSENASMSGALADTEKLPIPCSHCNRTVQIGGGFSLYRCSCGSQSRLYLCSTCGRATQTTADKSGLRWTCRWCGYRNERKDGAPHQNATVRQFHHELQRRGWTGTDPNRVALDRFTVVTAVGHTIPQNTACTLTLLTDALIVSPIHPTTDVVRYDHTELISIDIGGAGTVHKNAGLEGYTEQAAEIAEAVNRLTERTSIDNVIRIVTRSTSYLFHNDTYNPISLQRAFDVLYSRILQDRAVPEVDPLDQLSKLAQLRAARALNADEFAAAKSKLLDRLIS